MSVYERLYQNLRPALHALSMHGIRVDVVGMARLAENWKSRTLEIKSELSGLTEGIPLWSITEELSEEAKAAGEARSRALEAWKKRPAGHGPKSKLAEVQALWRDCERTRDRIQSLREVGKYYTRVVGVGLSDSALKDYLKSLHVRLPTKRNRETGKVSETADDISLKKIALARPELRPLAKLVAEHRKCLKMASTYCDVEKIDSDGRIRCSWKPCGTQTGRLASSENPCGTGLNQQNIPDHDEYGYRVKRLFLPDEGCVFLKFDLSMAEARNFFWRTGSKQLKEIATSRPWEVDVYKWLAGLILGKSPEEVTKKERQDAGKKIGLGSNYGMGAARMSDSLMKEDVYLSPSECQKLQEKLFSALPGIKRYQDKVINWASLARSEGRTIALRNSWGREIEFPEYRWHPGRIDQSLYNRLFAWSSQSDIGDHNNQLGLVPFWHNRSSRGWRSMPNAVVHDENLLSVVPREAWEIANFMKESLETPYDVGEQGLLSIPVTMSIGSTWQDVEEFKKFPTKDEFMACLEKFCRMMGLKRDF